MPDQSLFDSGISQISPQDDTHEVRFGKVGGAKTKRKQKSTNLSTAKRGKEKKTIGPTWASPRSAPIFAPEPLVINATPIPASPSVSRGHRQHTETIRPPLKELTAHPRSSPSTAPSRSSPAAAPVLTSVRMFRSSRGSRIPEVDRSSTSTEKIDLFQASLLDMLRLGRDLLCVMMLQWDLNSRRRYLRLEELINYGINSILDISPPSFFSLFFFFNIGLKPI